MGQGPKPAKGKAKPAVARKSPKSNDVKVRDLEKRLAEALEQQTATAEILRVISSSPTDIKPVLDAVARSAMQLCESYDAVIVLREGEELHFPVHHGPIRGPVQLTRRAISRGWVAGRAVLDRQPVHVHDLATAGAEFPVGQADAVRAGYRTTLSVPLLREGEAIGVIHLRRREVRPFTDNQIALLQTFAAQAVIAIENVRLFNETEEALEQQTATGDILRVIASSPTDAQPVFDAIAQNAMRLCDGSMSVVSRYDGELIHLGAHTHVSAEGVELVRRRFPMQPMRDNLHGRVVLDGGVVLIPDVHADSEFDQAISQALGTRSTLGVPMLLDGRVVGAIAVARPDVRPFTDKQIALLQTFADQAVIAIENVRLFKELQEKNKALTQAHAQVTETLEQQTATSEILRVIASSPTDVQPVFDTIAESAVRLSGGLFGSVYRFDGELIHMVAHHDYPRAALEFSQRIFPMRPNREVFTGRAILERAVINVGDVSQDQELTRIKEIAAQVGFQSVLSVPLMRDGRPVGAITVWRSTVGLFSDEHIALLQTFADQAVIAIENVRLFKELQASNRELTTALDKQTATSDILRVISQSQTDVQPVFDAIVESAVRLLRGFVAAISQLVGDRLELAAFTSTDPAGDAAVRAAFPQALTSDWPHSRVVRERGLLNVTDARSDPQVPEAIRNVAIVRGYQSLVVLPMLRHDEAIGAISVTRREPGAFTNDEISLLQTFADQAVIAIENVRLFRELESANRELAAASRHKSEFLANMSHELRTPLNAIIGFSEVLGDRMFGELNEKQEEYLKDINASGGHLLSLINDILDLSKIEAGRMELELTDFDLPTALDNALMLVRERAGRRSINLRISVDERLGEIQGDERKIRQVVLNLLSNAIKFTPEGGRIEVAAVPKDAFVEVSVRDSGVGIAPEDQEAVFEEFRQVGTADKKAEGTGLGLTLCRKFIELHGGKIWVKSQVGQGSTFTFTIPVRRGE